MSNLPRFREFQAWRKAEGKAVLRAGAVAKINKAHARIRIARQFKGLHVTKGSQSLNRGYSAGLRLFLAYSAAEALGDAISFHVSRWNLQSPPLLPHLERVASLLESRSDVLKGRARIELQQFVTGEHTNLRVVATALRHLVAHGDFTPSGTGLMTKSGADTIRQLGELLLAEAERQFETWFKRMSQA